MYRPPRASLQTASGLQVTVHSRLSDALVQGWRALWRRCPNATVFTHPDWVMSWLKQAPTHGAPYFVCVFARTELIGLAPLTRCAAAYERADLRLVGGEPFDYRDVLALPNCADAVAEAFLAALAHPILPWRHATFSHLPANSALLRAQCPPQLHCTRTPQDVCPYLPLPPTADALEQMLPAGCRQRLHRARRKARSAGNCTTQVLPMSKTDTGLRVLFDLHTARWRVRGEPGVLFDPSKQRFLRRASLALATAGLLRLLEVRLNGHPIAALQAFRSHRRWLLYISGIDPRFARLSPGWLALGAAAEKAVADGAYELDFLRGAETYKYAWGARNRWTHTLELAHAHTAVRGK